MIHLKKLEGKNIYTFSLEGDINKADVEKFYALLEESTTKEHKLKLLGIIDQFPGFENFKSFSSTMKFKTKVVSKISKYAIISNKGWIKSMLPISNFLTPGIPMKHFDLDKRNEAIAWLEKDEDNTYTEEKYLSKMDVKRIEDTNIYSFTLDGKIDEAGMTALYNILKDKNKNGKINLIGYYKDFDGFDSFKAFTEGIKVDFAAFSNLEKFAVVSDKNWVKTVIDIESKVIPGITMKTFSETEDAKALDWLKSN